MTGQELPQVGDTVDMERFHDLVVWPQVARRGFMWTYWAGLGSIKIEKHPDGTWVRVQ